MGERGLRGGGHVFEEGAYLKFRCQIHVGGALTQRGHLFEDLDYVPNSLLHFSTVSNID